MLLLKYLYVFFQKSKYEFFVHCVDVVKSYKSGYEGHPLFKFYECWVGCWDFFGDVYVGA